MTYLKKNKNYYKNNIKKFKLSTTYLINYFNKKFDLLGKKKFKLRPHRSEKICSITCKGPVYIHQGRTWVRLRLSKMHSGYKFGMFAATKKPFLFRPKKKKNKRNSRR